MILIVIAYTSLEINICRIYFSFICSCLHLEVNKNAYSRKISNLKENNVQGLLFFPQIKCYQFRKRCNKWHCIIDTIKCMTYFPMNLLKLFRMVKIRLKIAHYEKVRSEDGIHPASMDTAAFDLSRIHFLTFR